MVNHLDKKRRAKKDENHRPGHAVSEWMYPFTYSVLRCGMPHQYLRQIYIKGARIRLIARKVRVQVIEKVQDAARITWYSWRGGWKIQEVVESAHVAITWISMRCRFQALWEGCANCQKGRQVLRLAPSLQQWQMQTSYTIVYYNRWWLNIELYLYIMSLTTHAHAPFSTDRWQ